MLESISCPSCSTHYGLRPERVHSGLRRARCYKCADLFDIQHVVTSLLGPAISVEEPFAEDVIQADDFLDLDMSVLVPPEVSLEAEPKAVPESPVLSLSDLDDTEDEIFEKTLMVDPQELSPSVPDEGPEGSGGFASANDAIAKLMGNTPPPTPVADRRTSLSSHGNSMDVEATLNALEHTLGGSPVMNLAETGSPSSQESGSGSTVRLSSAELQAAMAAGTPQVAPISQAPTVAVPMMPKVPVAEAPTTGSDSNLMKVQLGTETVQNINLDQLTAWVEQGRVQEFHMVARQFSDNWIEAGKVPSLRPMFERMRRMGQPSASPRDLYGPPPETAPIKKGLFGWMSGRN
ncbi:MAG: hypothetical protein Q8O00_07020 [Holophaga sp.]|nr:hypothetical protein [Holophaga sp.]